MSPRGFDIYAWVVVVALWSRAWPSSTLPKMSLMSSAIEELTVVGLDSSCEMIEPTGMPLGVIAFKEDDGDDGIEEDGTDTGTAALWGFGWERLRKER